MAWRNPTNDRGQFVSTPIETRFWRLVQKTDGCWYWIGGTFPNSEYGRIWMNGKSRRAHCVSWELHNGSIPAGALICHTCDNPRCVRPDHLYAGTNVTNMADMVNRGRSLIGTRNPRARLTEADVIAIRSAHKNGAAIKALAREYNVDPPLIRYIVRRDIWKHVP